MIFAKNIYQTVINEPANYLQYYVGYLEITALKEKSSKNNLELTLI